MPTCASCGEQNPERARFCLSCGRPLEERRPQAEERKLVTVLFADLAGSTGLGERLDPERLKEILNAYFEAMRAEIEAEGGRVEKFIGDAIMAAFGAPRAHDDDPARALRAALRMRSRLEALNRRLADAHRIQLENRIGINSGDVVVTIEPKPGEALVTGDAVNVAARLEQSAAPGQIVVSERTARATRGFSFRELGTFTPRGKEGTVRALELVGTAPGPDRGIPGVRSPMVGRNRELTLLQALFERVEAEGRPHLVTIYGEAGVGKSRLVSEFVSWARDRVPELAVVRGRCLPYGDGVTYWALAEILKGRAAILDTDPPDVALDRVRRTAGELLSNVSVEPARATAALAYTVGLSDPEVDFSSLEPRQVALEVQAAWRSFFSALAVRGPLVVVVEDIHWADPALLDLLAELAARVQGPALFLCPSRPELIERRPAWGGGGRNASAIFLEPLPRAQAEQLVDALLAIEDLPAELRGRILDRAEGNPFFLEEIVRQLIDEGRIERVADRWRATSRVADVVVPDTVQAVLAARIDLLSAPDKRALQSAAVVGRTFWPSPVRLQLNGEAHQLDEALTRLEDRDLILPRLRSSIGGEREYSFKHLLTRDVAYGTLPRRQRARAHRAVARWIEATAGERRREFLELLAHHYREAHHHLWDDPGAEPADVEQFRRAAFDASLQAAEDALAKLALETAELLGDRALVLARDPLERARVLSVLGETALYRYDGDASWTRLREATDLLLEHAPQDAAAIARTSALALEAPVRHIGLMRDRPPRDELERYLEIGLSATGGIESDALVRLVAIRCASVVDNLQLSEDERERGRQEGERAAEIALRIGRVDLAINALDATNGFYVSQDRYGELEQVVERRLALQPQVRDVWQGNDTYNMAAWTAFSIGRYRQTLEYAEQDLEYLRDAPPVMRLAGCLPWRCVARFRLGDWDGCLEDYRVTQELLGGRLENPQPFFIRHLGAAGLVHELRGDRETADQIVDAIRQTERLVGFRTTWSAPFLARLAIARGDLDAAAASIAPDPRRQIAGLGLLLEGRCEVIAATGHWDDAPSTIAEARRVTERGGHLALPVFADRLEGRMRLARGELREAVRLLGDARAGFERLGCPWEEGLTRLDLADALASSGDRPKALDHLRQAAAVFERLGSVRDLDRARDGMMRVA